MSDYLDQEKCLPNHPANFPLSCGTGYFYFYFWIEERVVILTGGEFKLYLTFLTYFFYFLSSVFFL